MELRRCRNTTGWVGDFPLGRERRFVVRRVKTGVDDLRGAVERADQCVHLALRLRSDLLLCTASVINPSVGVFSYYGLENYVVFNCKFVV